MSKRRARAHGCGGAERTRRGAPAHGDGHPRRPRCKDIGSTAGAAFEEVSVRRYGHVCGGTGGAEGVARRGVRRAAGHYERRFCAFTLAWV